MKKIQMNRFVSLRCSALAIAVIALVTITGAWATAPSQSGGNPPGLRSTATAETATDSVTEVKIDNFAFTPPVVTVKPGTQVTWINRDDIPHTVDSTQGKFKSPAMDTDDKFQFRFTDPGEYPFYCRMHPKMTGKIIVQP